jgi:RNA recognition motif-containing protein
MGNADERTGNPMKNIFVGNLNSATTPEAIRSLFEPLGTIHHFKLMTDPDTGLSRGFAFIEMQDAEAGPAIAGLDGRIVDGQPIHVREGRPKLHRVRPATGRVRPRTRISPDSDAGLSKEGA